MRTRGDPLQWLWRARVSFRRCDFPTAEHVRRSLQRHVSNRMTACRGRLSYRAGFPRHHAPRVSHSPGRYSRHRIGRLILRNPPLQCRCPGDLAFASRTCRLPPSRRPAARFRSLGRQHPGRPARAYPRHGRSHLRGAACSHRPRAATRLQHPDPRQNRCPRNTRGLAVCQLLAANCCCLRRNCRGADRSRL